MRTRGDLLAGLPTDIFWPMRVKVPTDGDCVPYQLMLLWHFQFFVPAGDA